MFISNFKEKHERIVSIKDIDSDILENIIKYIYTLELDITEKNIEVFGLWKTFIFFPWKKLNYYYFFN